MQNMGILEFLKKIDQQVGGQKYIHETQCVFFDTECD